MSTSSGKKVVELPEEIEQHPRGIIYVHWDDGTTTTLRRPTVAELSDLMDDFHDAQAAEEEATPDEKATPRERRLSATDRTRRMYDEKSLWLALTVRALDTLGDAAEPYDGTTLPPWAAQPLTIGAWVAHWQNNPLAPGVMRLAAQASADAAAIADAAATAEGE